MKIYCITLHAIVKSEQKITIDLKGLEIQNFNGILFCECRIQTHCLHNAVSQVETQITLPYLSYNIQ